MKVLCQLPTYLDVPGIIIVIITTIFIIVVVVITILTPQSLL